MTREFFDDETPEVKEHVAAVQKAAKDEGENDVDEDDELDSDERARISQLAGFRRCAHDQIDTVTLLLTLQTSSVRASLPNTLVAMLQQIFREAGLIGTIILAGPDIEQGGNIYSLA